MVMWKFTYLVEENGGFTYLVEANGETFAMKGQGERISLSL